MAYQDVKNPATHFSMNLHPPFSPNDTAHHLVPPTAAYANIEIPSDLLHRCLGHWSIQVLGIASKSNLWADASLVPTEDIFCWGKSDLTHKGKLKPGSCLMLDLQQNKSQYGLNRATHFPYFLQITDPFICFAVLLGLSEVSAAVIFECLLHYAIWFKPNPTFETSDVGKIHTDAGSAFQSAEFISECEQHGIKALLPLVTKK